MSVYIVRACEKGDEKFLRLWLYKNNLKDYEGKTVSLLKIAVQHRRFKIVKLLLKHGAEPNVDKDETPLQLAVKKNSYRMTKLLLKHGANPNFCHIFYDSPIRDAVRNNNLKIVKLLIDHGADLSYWRTLNVACCEGYEEMVDLLLKHGAIIDISHIEAAIEYKHWRIVRRLEIDPVLILIEHQILPSDLCRELSQFFLTH